MNKINYQLSVIVPIFNAEEYISIFMENFCVSQPPGVELILVDDGSTDNSFQILNNYMNNIHIKIISIKHNGSAAARNIGLNLSSGKYVIFCDIDDYLDVFTAYILSKKMELYGFRILKNNYFQTALPNHKFFLGENIFSNFSHLDPNLVMAKMGFWTYIIERKFLSEKNIFFWPSLNEINSSYFVLDDWFFLLLLINSKETIMESENIIYAYYIGQQSNKFDKFIYQQKRLIYCYFRIFSNRFLLKSFLTRKSWRYILIDITRSLKYNVIYPTKIKIK